MDYQMLVLDLDGTLTNSRKEITEPTRNALIEIQREGQKKWFLPVDVPYSESFLWQKNCIWIISAVIYFPIMEPASPDAPTVPIFITKPSLRKLYQLSMILRLRFQVWIFCRITIAIYCPVSQSTSTQSRNPFPKQNARGRDP